MAVITGASAGIGEAIAWSLAKAGYDLALLARRVERLEALRDQILEGTSGVEVYVVKCDVRRRREVELIATQDWADRVAVVVNNAGLAKGVQKIQDGDPSDWEQMLETNVAGLLYTTRAFLPGMIKRKSGHIINLGSVAGRWVYPGGAVYCATKFAVRALSEGLRMDLMGTPIRVTNVEPGMVESEFSLVRLENAEKAKQVYKGMRPLTPQDIAETVRWCLDRPQHVNIQEIVIYPTDQAAISMVHRSEGF